MTLSIDGAGKIDGGTDGGLSSHTVYSSAGTYTWTKPSGVTKVKVYVTGGGGGGGSYNDDDGQGGGGAGGTAIKVIDVTGVSSVSVTVGGGAAATTANNSFSSGSTPGGTSSFGAYCSATGGAGPTNWGGGGIGGAGVGGDVNIYGGDAQSGNIDGSANSDSGGTGGASFWGGGGTGGSPWAVRQSARVPGAGGGGAHATYGSANGAGQDGIVVIEEYK